MANEENAEDEFSRNRSETIRTICVAVALVINSVTCVFAVLYYTGNIGP